MLFLKLKMSKNSTSNISSFSRFYSAHGEINKEKVQDTQFHQNQFYLEQNNQEIQKNQISYWASSG